MKDTSFETLKNNILEDIESCSKKDLDKIYIGIKNSLKKFDRDGIFKNCKDMFKNLLKNSFKRVSAMFSLTH